MNLQEYNKRLGDVIKQTQTNDNGRTMVKVAIKAWTLIRGRVIEQGINAKGQKFAPYSTKPMLVGCDSFVQKSACSALLGSKNKRRELEWKTVNGHRLAVLQGGYKQFREMQGRRTDITNFSFTNDMWNDIAVNKESDLVSKQSDHVQGIAIIGAKEQEQKKKLEGNTKRRGDILDLSQAEIEDLKSTYALAELEVFRNNGL